MSFIKYLREELGQSDTQRAAEAIRDLFLSKEYDGVVPTSDLEKIFTDSKWLNVFGSEAINQAWKEIYNNNYVSRDMTKDVWVWVNSNSDNSTRGALGINPISGHGITYTGNITSLPFRPRGTGMI